MITYLYNNHILGVGLKKKRIFNFITNNITLLTKILAQSVRSLLSSTNTSRERFWAKYYLQVAEFLGSSGSVMNSILILPFRSGNLAILYSS